LIAAWGTNPDHCADKVTSATVQPPPDGVVDGADLAYLMGSWGLCCDFSEGGESLMMGGSSESESDESESVDLGPFAGTYLGLLLEELIATSDDELAAVVAEMLLEMMSE